MIYDINNGLFHNGVTCVLKGDKGFMCFGTLSGLNRYDGFNFKIFKYAVGNTTSLDNGIVSVAEAPDNKLWVETRNDFNIYDPATEKFRHDVTGVLKIIVIPDRYIAAIKKDQSGCFWFIHLTPGLFEFDPVTKKTVHLIHSAANSSSIYFNSF